MARPKKNATNCEHINRPAKGRGLCRTCYDRYLKETNPDYKIRQAKNSSDWAKQNKSKKNQSNKQSYRKNQHRVLGYQKQYQLKTKYGIDLDKLRAMIQLQNSQCPICRLPFGDASPCVDHDHKTGRVRGLLCHKCNVALGVVNDSIDSLSRAIQYLQFPPFNLLEETSGV